jgi:hypothetical protein
MKMGFATMATASLMLSSLGALAQSNRIYVELDGQKVPFRTVQPIQEGRETLVPLRPIFTKLGGQMLWERDTNSISLMGKNNFSARIYPGKNVVQADGNNIDLDTAPRIIRGQTMVPIEFFQRVLGLYTQENLGTGAIALQTGKEGVDNQVRVTRSATRNRTRRYSRADIEAYNRNRLLADANYYAYLHQQDFNRYLNQRAAWEQGYRNYLGGNINYLGNVAVVGPFQGVVVTPQGPYSVYLYNQDFMNYMTNRALWQRNYQAYLDMINQNNGAFPNETLTNEANWQNYLQARDALIQQQNNRQNNPAPRNNAPR